ncbi:helix-turn-helix domain-containing protein [Actinoplanes sp. CA-131856]
MIEALTRSRGNADPSVLVSFVDTLLDELPWWDRSWRVADVGEPRSSSSSRGLPPGAVQVVEVTVPGSLGRNADEVQPFSARLRLLGDRLLRWQMKAGDTVIGPALAPAGESEPHPFGAVFRLLAEMRGLTIPQLARRTERAESTIRRLRAGGLVPERTLIEEVAHALDLPAADLAAIADLDPADPGGRA